MIERTPWDLSSTLKKPLHEIQKGNQLSHSQLVKRIYSCHFLYLSCNFTKKFDEKTWYKLNIPQQEPIEIYIDNKLTIALVKNPVFHDRRKHINTHYQFIKERVTKKEVQLKHTTAQDHVVTFHKASQLWHLPHYQESLRRDVKLDLSLN